jgi:amino acid transporter
MQQWGGHLSILDIVLGRRLANSEGESRRIGWFEAVPAMGLDGLGSASYGPEAALTVLAPLGAASLGLIGWVMAPIIVLLGVLYLSYRQTVAAYQTNGGAYTVAKENLGRNASLLAAAAIMIDYTLNVAVGISAGVGALTSIVPSLQPHTLELCLAILAMVTLANLRGTGEAGLLFSAPTYLFILALLAMMAVGLARIVAGGGHPHAVVSPPPLHPGAEAASAWLLMRAFAAGCTAMTGVEAVSNGVGAFKTPVEGQARRTLTIICLTLGLLLAGVAALAHGFGVGAMDQTRPGYQSVLSQLAGAVVGRGALYDVIMASILAVLCLSANTSFVGFPRLCRLVAEDGFLPRTFAMPGRRLVFSVGIGFLTAAAGGLLILFDGITDRLIPLFAIGAFLTFTMSQVGMVAHWRKQSGHNRARAAINALGATITVLALAVIVVTKFVEGAWIVVLAIPALLALLLAIRRYYDALDESLACEGPFTLDETQPPTILVAFEGRNRMTDRALRLAMTLSPDVLAVHLMSLEGPDTDESVQAFKRDWEAQVSGPLERRGLTAPRLVVLPAPYRQIHKPLLELIDKLDAGTPGRSVAVLIPQLVLDHWWEIPLHAFRADRLRAAVLAHVGPRLIVITSPWRRRPAKVSTAQRPSAR